MNGRDIFDVLLLLQLVEVRREVGQSLLESLPLLGVLANLVGLRVAGGVQGVALHLLPVVEHALGEGLAAGVGAEVGREAERLVDGQVRLHVEHGGAHDLGLFEHVAAATVKHAVDASHGVLGTLKNYR